VRDTNRTWLSIGLASLLIGGVLFWLFQADFQMTFSGLAGAAGLLMLLPVGLLLLTASGFPTDESEAALAATTGLVIWAIAVLAYFGAGFAFQFGGLANISRQADFADLYWNWSPLSASYGLGWGVIGLRGWGLLGQAGTPGVYDLFLRHIALLGVVIIIPAFNLYRRLNVAGMVLFGILSGTLIYPLIGNWIWSGGWLMNLGLTLGLGHGFVDAGVATPLAVAGIISLAAAVVFGRRQPVAGDNGPAGGRADEAASFVEIPMPPAYRLLLALFGLGLILWSWPFITTVAHIPASASIGAAAPIDAARAALNGVLSALTAALAAALYSHFTTVAFNPLMALRGAVAGLVAVSTVAPFIPPWQAVVVGALVGLLTPLLIYLVDHILKLQDATASIAIFAFTGFLAWLLPGLLADGSGGAGWSNVGMEAYLNVEGQGISGLLVATGYAPDWPGQLQAQLLGAAAVFGWSFLIAFVYFEGYRRLAPWLATRSSGSEVAADDMQLAQMGGEALVTAASLDGHMITADLPSLHGQSARDAVGDNNSAGSEGDVAEPELDEGNLEEGNSQQD